MIFNNVLIKNITADYYCHGGDLRTCYSLSDFSKNWTDEILNLFNSSWDNNWVNQWAYNQTNATFNNFNSTWDNSWANKWAYNHTLDTYNKYDTRWLDGNASWNQSLADTFDGICS